MIAEKVTRYVPTYLDRATGLRTLMRSAQGRYTYETPEAAQAWIDAVTQENSAERIASVWGYDPQFEVRPCECWAHHFDPVGVYFFDANEVRNIENAQGLHMRDPSNW
jgi:hypothetical protein